VGSSFSDRPSDAPIFLVGFMASGKSTVGRILAARLGWEFRDLDRVIADEAARTIPEIFSAEGEDGFRRREADALRRVATLRRTVIATGGGAACQEDNLAAMLGAGSVVALAVTADEVMRRAGPRSTRPLLAGAAEPLAAASELLRAREPFYARAHARVETAGRTPEEVAAEVLRVIEARAS
jgi:shikimate kinase